VSDRIEVSTVGDGVARVQWPARANVDELRREIATALLQHHRVEALVDPADNDGQRTATWSGLLREGVTRGLTLEGSVTDRIVYARTRDDVPLDEPQGFRALLNSFLPRKRAISQMLLRDPDGRVLLCQLTYKRDWDLPGGVVEVSENPREAVAREVEEELGLTVTPGDLLLTDWMPPWGGWDDAVCLVFDGGELPASTVDEIVRQEREIRDARFLTVEEIEERAADFTARRIRAALTPGTTWTESGR
jgi:8-oxo-dGTP pyrophosphatase MutT (NUDIX family)